MTEKLRAQPPEPRPAARQTQAEASDDAAASKAAATTSEAKVRLIRPSSPNPGCRGLSPAFPCSAVLERRIVEIQSVRLFCDSGRAGRCIRLPSPCSVAAAGASRRRPQNIHGGRLSPASGASVSCGGRSEARHRCQFHFPPKKPDYCHPRYQVTRRPQWETNARGTTRSPP